MFPADLILTAEALSHRLREQRLVVTTAESCTGGLIAGLITHLPGSSDILDRGFVTYSNEAKHEMLGVPSAVLDEHGAVSEQVARAMVSGAIANSDANSAVAVTGVAGPGGGTEAKPVGLVHIAAQSGPHILHRRCLFGDIGREQIRLDTIRAALLLLNDTLDLPPV